MNLFGYKFSKDVNIFLALKSVFGLGDSNVYLLLGKLGLSPFAKVGDVDAGRLRFLVKFARNYFIFGADLRRYIRNMRKQKSLLRNYQGMCFIYNLPLRGQKTKTNAVTARKLNRV